MKTMADNPFDALEKIFHEPNRLAIMSALCAADGGVAFTDLKAVCRLTDGNLSRHLRALEETGVIRLEKTFVQLRPRTTIHLTKTGLKRFNEYLAALEKVLGEARSKVEAKAPASIMPAIAKTVRA
jgi:DNA-binding transcriptional ArsR family regulator